MPLRPAPYEFGPGQVYLAAFPHCPHCGKMNFFGGIPSDGAPHPVRCATCARWFFIEVGPSRFRVSKQEAAS
jgi:hypothetical protein